MNNTIMVHAGRQFSPEEIELIKWTRRNFKDLSRKELAETVCEFLNWKTNSGKVRISICIDFLIKMEDCNLIKLPEIQKKEEKKAPKRKKVNYVDTNIEKTEITCSVKDLEDIALQIVKSDTEDMRKWKNYVDKYHMLGEKTIFGDRIYYFIKSGEKELGCLSFGSSALSLKERENWIGWNSEQKKKNLFLIVNNSRFLILPWIKMKILASKVLSLVGRQIQNDWKENYCYEPVLLETFVDLEHFKGTCYKAANWLWHRRNKRKR